MLLADEIAEERQVHGVEVEAPGGYAKVLTAYKTIPLPVWELYTSDGIVLECSHHHLLATPLGLVKACNLTPGRELVSSNGTVYVVSSEDTGRVEPLYDITVDREDGLFYSNGLLSHNSTTFCSRQLMHSCLLPGYRALYITPYFEQLKTYADRLIDMEGQVRYDVGKQNKYVKHYANGSKLWLSYACESADHVRGKTVGECITGDTVVHVVRDGSICDVPVSSVIKGDYILSYENGEIKYNEVQATICKGMRPVWRVSIDSGQTVCCTAEHLIYTTGGWKTVAELRQPGGDDYRVAALVTCEGKDGYADRSAGADDTRNLVRGWEYVLHGNALQLQGGSVPCAERVFIGEGTSVASRYNEGESAYSEECGVWQYTRLHEYASASYNGSLRRDVLQQSWEKTGDAGVGRQMWSGSCSVVVHGRWFKIRRVGTGDVSYGEFFHTRSGNTCEHAKTAWLCFSALHESAQKENTAHIQRNTVEHERYLPVLSCNSSLRPAESWVQNRCTSSIDACDLHRLREGYCSSCELQCRAETCLPGVQVTIGHAVSTGAACAPYQDGAYYSKTERVGASFLGRGLRDAEEGGAQCLDEERREGKIECVQKKKASGCKIAYSKIVSIENIGTRNVYDIQVDRAHNFFANGILAHNCLIDECITGDAKVCCITGDGGVPTITALKDVKVGWKIRAFDRDTLEVSFEEVTDWMCKGMRHCWTLRTRSGCELTATDNHKMVTVAGKKYVAELVEAVLSGAHAPDLYRYDEASNTLIMESIVEVKDAGEHEVYDITVNRHNTFIVNELGSSNCQNMNPDLVPEILKTQQMSKTPMTVYSGTALTTDTLLEQRWLMSSQGCYHVRSADGKHWINLHDPEELWKVTDNREYPIDYYTGKPLNVTDGVFVHANQDALADGDIGLHIPMIVVPSNCRGTQWAQIYKDVKTQPPAKTLQENFGIAIGDGAKEISEADLKAICVLRHTPQELAGKLATGYYRLVVMGCDWGGSDYNPATKSKQSYSVCCVLGLAPDGKLDILHAKKYAGMDYTVIIGDMLKAYRDYKCNAIASDYGMGAVYTMLIRQHVPWQRHFIMQYAAPNCAAFQAVAGSELPNHYSVNKTEAVTNTFISVREGGLRAKSWEDMSYYLMDFLAVHREMNDTPTGKRQFKWNRDPRKPDDFLHAVSFAMTLVKVYTGERVVADPSLLRQIRNTLNGRQAGPDLAGIPPVISG